MSTTPKSHRTTHTPGPWKVIPSIHGRGYSCVQIGSDELYTTLELLPKDARLIAVAPEMLCELREVLEWATTEKTPLGNKEIKHIRAVIAKAEGR